MLHSLILRGIRFIVLGSLLLSALPGWAGGSRTDSLLRMLDQTLVHQASYDKQRLDRLAALKAELRSEKADANASFTLSLLICDEYQVFTYDSAFVYSLKMGALARQLRSPVKLQTARTKLAYTLRSAGLFKDAFDTLKAIDVRQLEPRYKAEFYEIYSIVCIELAEYDQDAFYQPYYTAQSDAYADTAARYSRPGSYPHLAQQLYRAKQRNDLGASMAIYAQLQRLPLTAHQVAINASSMAKLYENAGLKEKALQFMALAAISDIKSATKEGIALFKVSDYCYQRGDLSRARWYISEARKAANFYKARQRLVQMSPISTLIDGRKISLVEKQRQQANIYALAIGVLATLLLGTAFVIYFQLRRLQSTGRLLAATNQELHQNNVQLQALNARQQDLNGKLQELNQGLNEANHVKEEYIGYYFNNTSRYIDKLEVLQKKLSTLLSTKQVASAQQLVKDIDIKSERNALFKGFDTAFIHLFPNFVAEFNALFTEADRIQLADEHLLTTELRIFALIRLGISDSEQISRILGYSIHTVYAYKTRVKNRSFLPNETFEARVLAIQAT
ncbi:DUF6377 domain-containing protein [Hymenobacter glacieicola]|uniref:DUF6377 domain-containing protein n=1 Tax=Hymenobacter glacieicola TaxID=1562124 RepID=A0ABQ1WLS7_9BACT|nr:DUF6377 domain-containing protein [Hymenobacter glacieicola]GGG36035.1 hypothetical protein GCM10011378_10420 [Hymenobacter glacieicola]